MKKIFYLIGILALLFSTNAYAQMPQNDYYTNTSITTKQQTQEKILLGSYRVTFYCSCSSCCGQWAGSPTASGSYPTANYTCACGDNIPFGTTLYVEGLGTYVCEDRGVSNECIDIYVNDHSEIPSWGMDYLNVYKIIK